MSKLKLILGTMEMGRAGLTEKSLCYEMLDIFFKEGYNELDTALLYADGNSEKILGDYMLERSVRDQVVIASKVNPFFSTLSKENVKLQALACLESLKTPYMNVLYLHAPDHSTPIEETLGAVQQVYQEGKFKEFGLSNFAAWEVSNIYHICKSNGWVLPTVYQGMYNPITRKVEGELFPALRHYGIRFYAYNPLAGGLLSGRYQAEGLGKEQDGRFWTVGHTKMYRDRYWRASMFEGVAIVKEALEQVYGADQVSLVNAVFRWMNHHSMLQGEDAIIIGCSKKEHMIANMDACKEGPLDPRVVQAFDKAWDLDKANCVNYFR